MRTRLPVLLAAACAVALLGLLPLAEGQAAYTVEVTELVLDLKRINKDVVNATLTYKWRLNDNYSTLKLYHRLMSSLSAVKNVATKTVTFSNYVNGTNGTSGLVSQSEAFLAYEATAYERGLTSGSKTYLWVGVYNDSVSSANHLANTSDMDYWPSGGRDYSTTTTTTAADDGTPLWKLGLIGIGAVTALIIGALVIAWVVTKAGKKLP